MNSVTVAFALECMQFEEYTQIFVKQQSGRCLRYIFATPYSSIIKKRYGSTALLRSYLSNSALYLVIE